MNGTKIVMIIFISFGGILALFGIGTLLSANSAQSFEDNFNENAIEVQAYVEEVKKIVDRYEGVDNNRTEIYYETRVSYTVNGKEYNEIAISDVRSDRYSNDVGSYITVYCLEDNPTLIRYERSHDDIDLLSKGLGIGLIICGVTLAGGVIIPVKADDYRKKKAIENMKNGYM